MKVLCFNSVDSAEEFLASQMALLFSKSSPVRALLPTGNTMIGVYGKLVKVLDPGKTYEHVTTFNLDEYLDAPSEITFKTYMEKHLFQHLPGAISHFPASGKESRYEDMLRDPVDLCVLGIGKNGHIGFNEPGAEFDSVTRPVDLSPTTLQANGLKETGVTQAITVGIETILRSKKIFLLATGSSKGRAVRAAVEGEASLEVPASALQSHRDVTIILDSQAASALSESTKMTQM